MDNLNFVGGLVVEAGGAVLELLAGAGGGRSDALSRARECARQLLSAGFRSRHPRVPVVFGREEERPGRARGSRFWLLDPLDGTDGSGWTPADVTLTAALVEGGAPVLGAVCAPARGLLYLAERGKGCWKVGEGARITLRREPTAAGAPVRVVLGKTQSPDTISLIDLLPGRSVTLNREGALRFCAVAEGAADFFPVLERTPIGSTAAGQLVVTEAGGVVVGPRGAPLSYDAPESTNDSFVVAPSLEWLSEVDLLDYPRKVAEAPYEICAISCR